MISQNRAESWADKVKKRTGLSTAKPESGDNEMSGESKKGGIVARQARMQAPSPKDKPESRQVDQSHRDEMVGGKVEKGTELLTPEQERDYIRSADKPKKSRIIDGQAGNGGVWSGGKPE